MPPGCRWPATLCKWAYKQMPPSLHEGRKYSILSGQFDMCGKKIMTKHATDRQTDTDLWLQPDAYKHKGWFCISSLLHNLTTPAAYAEPPESLVYIETYSQALPFALVALCCGSILVSTGSQEHKFHHVSWQLCVGSLHAHGHDDKDQVTNEVLNCLETRHAVNWPWQAAPG